MTKAIKSIGEVIKAHFSRNQQWLSDETGISQSQLSKKINGRIPWKQKELDKINKVLGENFKL